MKNRTTNRMDSLIKRGERLLILIDALPKRCKKMRDQRKEIKEIIDGLKRASALESQLEN